MLPARRSSIQVVGTVVMDLLSRVDRIPIAGETVLGRGGLRLRLGGKGFNQAIFAAQALGRDQHHHHHHSVTFDACVGNDEFGKLAKRELQRAGVLHRLQIGKQSTGTGSICLEESTGENCIVVSLGANQELDLEEQQQQAPSIVVGQLELPIKTTLKAFRQKSSPLLRVLNAAPVPADVNNQELAQLLRETDLLVVNQVEAQMLGGGGGDISLERTAQSLLTSKLSARALGVVVTLGKRGAFYLLREGGGQSGEVPATAHVAVDTVGAGDCFVANLVAQLALERSLLQCIASANQAAGEYVAVRKPDSSLGDILQS